MNDLLEQKRYVDYFATMQEQLEAVVAEITCHDWEVKLVTMETIYDNTHELVFDLEDDMRLSINLESQEVYILYEFNQSNSAKEDTEVVIRLFKENGFEVYYD